MKNMLFIHSIIALMLLTVSCSAQESKACQSDTHKKEPHRYGGWYCPDNFGFVPVDINKLDEVPAIAHRLPTEEELKNHASLIKVDIEKYPDAKALDMDLPRVARIYSDYKGMEELIIIIQAIVVSGDTIVGYRFPNGGNGSAWLSDVDMLSENEVSEYGSQPFFYHRQIINATKEDIWEAMSATEYFKNLGSKFDKKDFFSTYWTEYSEADLHMNNDHEKAKGYVGTVFGNAYMHIDYVKDGSHYSEKLLMIENREDNSTELFFACGPFPEGFEKEESKWNYWFKDVVSKSEMN